MPSQQRGVVLISVLLIFAAATVLVVSLQLRFMRTVKAQGLVAADAQAREYYRGAELLAGLQLQEDAFQDLQNDRVADHQGEVWAQLQAYPIDGGEIRTQLLDLQGRLNLSALQSDKKVQMVFIRLLEQLQIPSDDRLQPQDILTVLLDWMDADQEQRGFVEAEDDFYLNQGAGLESSHMGYKTSETALVHVSELLLMRGLSKADYVALSKHVTFLPQGATININSVSLPFARALNGSAGEELISNRPEDGFTREDMAALADSQRPSINFGVDSTYYELRVEVVLGDVKRRGTSLIHLPTAKDPQNIPQPLVYERDLGWSYYYTL